MLIELIIGIVIVFIIILIYQYKNKPPESFGYLLDDSGFERDNKGFPKSKELGGWLFSNKMGHSVLAIPPDQYLNLDFTAYPGGISGLYYSLCFQLGKWEYNVYKSDEWIEVSPTNSQYFALTHKQKEEMEIKIKQSLGSIAQMIADVELLKHDQRKYKEFLDYFGYEYNENKREFIEKPERKDEHSLKAVFIDQVDVHTGDGISMRSIVSRWPTLIIDFMKLEPDDTDADKLKKKLGISKAEAVVLVTKNKLYEQWKRIFEPEIKSRYMRIFELLRSREESVKQYRQWLKPIIARHKLFEEGLSRPEGRKMLKTSFISPAGQATSLNTIVLYVWKDMVSPEFFKSGTEPLSKKPIRPDDEWTRRNLIYNKNKGLIAAYPWITDAWIEEKKKNMLADNWINLNNPYYSFFIITINKTNIRTPTGSEFEDGILRVNSIFMSMNVLFVKLLELKAKEEEFERYIDNMLGLKHEIPGKEPEVKKKTDYLLPLKRFFEFFGLAFSFIKTGPYDTNAKDRITKYYLVPHGAERFGTISKFIKQKVGVGKR